MTVGELWAGVDVGKEQHWVCVVNDTGAVVLSRKLVNDERQIRELVTEVDRLGGTQVSWTVDLTTVYAALLLTVLADVGKSVRYLAGRAVWQASAVYRGGEAKTDAKDARVIADQSRMRGDDLPILHPDDDLIAELRMLTGHRADLVADRTAVGGGVSGVGAGRSAHSGSGLGRASGALPEAESYSAKRYYAIDPDTGWCWGAQRCDDRGGVGRGRQDPDGPVAR
jgi:hypothetical protein